MSPIDGLKPENSLCSPSSDNRQLVKWLETQPEAIQIQKSAESLKDLLDKAAQPRHVSGDACIKLCYFIEQCRASKSAGLSELVLSERTLIALYTFFIEWNEKNQNRSMRQVLELLSSLISSHPKKETAVCVKHVILTRTVSILAHGAAQPLVKPTLKLLECFLSKGTISPPDLIEVYQDLNKSGTKIAGTKPLESWDKLIGEMFDWMTVQDVAPAAGKCLVTLFGQLRKQSSESMSHLGDHTYLWQRWIRKGLSAHPDSLDNVKNYLFPPLFKTDRAGSLALLEDLNQQRPMSDITGQELDAHALLQLAALEVGKKAGLVVEPSITKIKNPLKKAASSVTIQEEVIGPLMTHATSTVRSLAFSVLVSSPSPIKPFNVSTLDSLRSNLGPLHADTDGGFRNEIMSNTRHMIERLRGASAHLAREIQTLSFVTASAGQEEVSALANLLQEHEGFVKWYLRFLLGELIPTSSYQRHITALKSITLLLNSDILGQKAAASVSRTSDHATIWPYTINIFTSGAMRLLFDLLMDPFDDVRSSAAFILKLAPPNSFTTNILAGYMGDVVAKFKSPNREPPTGLAEPVNRREESYVPTSVESLFQLTSFINRATQVAKKTGRADYADGVARSYELMYSIISTYDKRLDLVGDIIDDLALKVAIAEQDLSRAVLDAPVHGNFAALCFIWEAIDISKDCQDGDSEKEHEIRKRWDSHHRNIYLICSRIWAAVKDVLCNDSPEGHLPEDLDNSQSVDTKDILSYSFRAIHESSNLMRNIASKLKPSSKDSLPFLDTEIFAGIGNLTFDQLSSLRHRGAFSTVSLTFAKCCQLTQVPSFIAGLNAPNPIENWYQGSLNCIFQQASTTRRSAGIPALMTGILSASAQIPAFEDVMTDLKSISRIPVKLSASDQTNLPQVHAMNSLKEVFKSSILGKKAEVHLAECLELAADGLNSEIWAIRNCALLLLRSLIDCLFGTNESKAVTEAGWDGKSIKLSYDKHPSLPDLLLKLLDTNTNNSADTNVPVIGSVESVFPALDIIRRAGPPPTHRDSIYRCVSTHLGSKIWHVREIAARTICTMLFHDKWLTAIIELMKSSHTSTNRHHGVLMAVKFILERRLRLDPASATDGLDEIASLLRLPDDNRFFDLASPEILATYLELGNNILEIILVAPDAERRTKLAPLITNLFAVQPYEEFTSLIEMYLQKIESTGGYNSDLYAALGNSIARRAVYTSALEDDALALQNILIVVAALNTDVTLSAIECIPLAWKHNISREALIGISEAYLTLLKATDSPEIQSVAMEALAESLDQKFNYVSEARSDENCLQVDRSFEFDTEELRRILEHKQQTPSTSNGRIRISGCILLSEYVSQRGLDSSMQRYRGHLEEWGQILCVAGDSKNDFETRLAAAETMASFYGNQHFGANVIGDECALQSLFALYDSLNDDDDEIRDLSATTASSLIKKSLLPLAASKELARYINAKYKKTSLYASNVVCRMTGNENSHAFRFEPVHLSLQAAASHLSYAMQEDDSLFVEEEQNLFVDEVRETKLWKSIFVQSDLPSWEGDEVKAVWGRAHFVLAHWVLNGLETLNTLLTKSDGPLGWTSKPATFAICMRIVVSANAILERHEGLLEFGNGGMIEQIRAALKEFEVLGRERRCHESLLFEINAI